MFPLQFILQAHPWHGISAGSDAPAKVTAYIEIVPTDTVKYELDKETGHLKVDRVQRYSSLCPTLYGFIPQTYCDVQVAALAKEHPQVTRGDGDPLDICVLTEKSIPKGGFLLKARPIGGMRMIDGNEADDKIVAVLEGDLVYGALTELEQAPQGVIERLRHYFLSYKQLPAEAPRRVDIGEVYGAAKAQQVIQASRADYDAKFGAQATKAHEALSRK
jgi:inorganic pyrophosphatase